MSNMINKHAEIPSLNGTLDESSIIKVSEDSPNICERGTWGHRFEFLLSCLGYAVGFGNLWRFPFKCYDNGGGAFLIPYFVALFVAGLPLFLMELALGQYSSLGPIKLFHRLSPAFAGIGIAMVVISIMVSIYYNMIMAWTLFYLADSFKRVLPWSNCENAWNTENCYDTYKALACAAQLNSTNYTSSSPLSATLHSVCVSFLNASTIVTNGRTTTTSFNLDLSNTSVLIRESPAEQYFNYRMLRVSGSLSEVGSIQWDLAVCLLLAWTGVYLCLMHGIKTTGKVVYFTALFPYVILIILLVRAVTLPGATSGMLYYIKPDWGKLAHFKVWKDAFLQIFYSLGPAFGSLMTLSSYNSFNHNFYRDGIIVSLLNGGTSIFSGFVVFAIIGFMALQLETEVDKVIKSGLGLAFVAYPTAITQIRFAPLWSVLFFLMLITIGLDSQFAMVETILTTICDKWPTTLRPRKKYVSLLLCLTLFLVGLPQTTNAGIYIFSLMDQYSAGWPLLFISLAECLLIAYLYGIDRFMDDIQVMIGFRINVWWKICWCGFAPFCLTILMLYDWVTDQGLTYGSYRYPPWAEVIGWAMALVSVLFIPAYLIYYCLKIGLRTDASTTTINGRWKAKALLRRLFAPTDKWDRSQERLIANRESATSFALNKT